MLSWFLLGETEAACRGRASAGHGIEDLGADAYDRYGYYERWMASMTNILLEKKVIEVSELGARMGRDRGRRPAGIAMSEPVPQFAPGDRVRVLHRFPPGHVRTPWYCRGKPGEVERICGQVPQSRTARLREPGCGAPGAVPGPLREPGALAGLRRKTSGTASRSRSTNTGSHRSRETRNERTRIPGRTRSRSSPTATATATARTRPHRHPPPARPRRHSARPPSIDADGGNQPPHREGGFSPPAKCGPRSSTWIPSARRGEPSWWPERGWTTAFANASSPIRRARRAELGMDLGPIPILVMENTPETHHLVVCTLCSCYPRFLLGLTSRLVQVQELPEPGGA